MPLMMTVDSRSYLRYLSCNLKLNRLKETPFVIHNLLNFVRMNNATDIFEIDIDLSRNRLTLFNKDLLDTPCCQSTEKTRLDSRNLKGLNLSDNALGSHLKNASDLGLFSNFINLLKLDLSLNDVTYLPKRVFAQQNKLQFLKLNTNFCS